MVCVFDTQMNKCFRCSAPIVGESLLCPSCYEEGQKLGESFSSPPTWLQRALQNYERIEKARADRLYWETPEGRADMRKALGKNR